MIKERFVTMESRLAEMRLVPVVSLPSVDAGMRLAEILIRCQLPVMEVTFRTPFAPDAIVAMKAAFPDLLILAGTVLTEEQLAIAVDSGAESIVLPGFERKIVDSCLAREIFVCPGAITPSEVLQCRTMGLHALKFFPAELAGGINMLKAMAAVFQDIRFMPTGGVNLENVTSYLALDNVFCCGGSWLAPEKLMSDGDWQEIENRISKARSLLASGNE